MFWSAEMFFWIQRKTLKNMTLFWSPELLWGRTCRKTSLSVFDGLPHSFPKWSTAEFRWPGQVLSSTIHSFQISTGCTCCECGEGSCDDLPDWGLKSPLPWDFLGPDLAVHRTIWHTSRAKNGRPQTFCHSKYRDAFSSRRASIHRVTTIVSSLGWQKDSVNHSEIRSAGIVRDPQACRKKAREPLKMCHEFAIPKLKALSWRSLSFLVTSASENMPYAPYPLVI